MENEYCYNEAISRFYDPVYDKLEFLEPARKFYHDEILSVKGPVLEAGVGTGRIFLPALNEGADIYGVDVSENMLNYLKMKLTDKQQFRISIGDIRTFKPDRKYDLIISPFRVFQHLLTIEDQLNALHNIYDSLNDGGRYIFDVFYPDIKRLINDVDDILEFEGEIENGNVLKRFVSVRNDTVKQIINVTFRFEWNENNNQYKDEFYSPMRYFFRYELENLVGRTKFNLEKFYGSFECKDFGLNPKEQILILRK